MLIGAFQEIEVFQEITYRQTMINVEEHFVTTSNLYFTKTNLESLKKEKTHTTDLKKFSTGESILNVKIILILYYLTVNYVKFYHCVFVSQRQYANITPTFNKGDL